MNLKAMEEYEKWSGELHRVKQWLSMDNKPYHGGGGGTGRAVKCEISAVEIYFQASDGARNYHDADKSFLSALSDVVLEDFTELAAKAVSKIETKFRESANAAVIELEKLMKDAGIINPEVEERVIEPVE
jgi:hypothetical protein